MTLVGIWSEWMEMRYRIFMWRTELGIGRKVALSVGMAFLTGILAQIRIPLGATPVPITGQVFGVLLAGVLLGKHFGAFSQIVYVALGTVGISWFSGWTFGALAGPTGGYLVGFVAAAALIGWLTDTFLALRALPGQFAAMILGLLLIYLCGAVQFAFVMQTGVRETMILTVWPFVPFDLAKALCAAAIAAILLPNPADRGKVSGRAISTGKEPS